MLFSISDSALWKAAAAGLLLAARVNAECSQIAGNYYCSQVSQVIYENIGFSGSYNQVTSFDTDSCSCQSSSVSFSGSLSPLDEEISIHFRGPLNLKQFAYYSYNATSSTKKKRDDGVTEEIAKRHVHHVHKRAPDAVYVTEVVTAYVNGQAATPTTLSTSAPSQVAGSGSSSSSAGSPAGSPAGSSAGSSASSSAGSSKSSSAAVSSSSGAGWTRQSYYDASSASSSGLVFLNNLGGSAGSGVWDTCFGNSLSYCNSDGVTGAASSQILNDVTIPSNKEFSIFTGTECSGNSCGYYRPGIPAYHGFGGNYKVFGFEFSMPSDSGSSAEINGDMPAIWMLNAQIPRTLQYGNSACSCWSTGCGEFDVFEVLNAGNQFLTSHLHSGQGSTSTTGSNGGGGTGDYIARPVDGTMKAAVIFSDSSITITVLDDSTTFDSFVSDSTIAEWIAQGSSSSTSVSI